MARILTRTKITYRRMERRLVHWAWLLKARFGPEVHLDIPEKATAIIPSYSSERLGNIEPLARSLLKCDFIEKVILSNHNPDNRLEDWVKIEDERVVICNQPARRGAGYAWFLASREDASYILFNDDDLLLFPRQYALIFQHLVAQPQVPHGLIGRSDRIYYMNREMEVDNLYEVYAATQLQARRYCQLVEKITSRGYADSDTIEYWADDVIISHTGEGKPRIHDAGYLLRCPTATKKGVATYREAEFKPRRQQVRNALRRLEAEGEIDWAEAE